MVELLVKKKASLVATTKQGKTPLDLAASPEARADKANTRAIFPIWAKVVVCCIKT